MGEERKRAHRRALVLGLGVSAVVHAAVLGWTGFSVPGAQSSADGTEPGLAPPDPAFEVIRLVEVPAAVDAPAQVAAEPAGGRSAEGSPAAGAPATSPPAAEMPAGAETATAVDPDPVEADSRASPVPTRPSTRDLRVGLAPPTLAIDLPRSARDAPSRAGTAEGGAGDDRPDVPAGAAPDGEPVAVEPPAAEAAGAVGAGEEDAEEEGKEGGGWGLGDLFRGISVTISAGGTCLPDLVNGRPSPAVTSVNDRNPVGGGLRGIGPSGPTEPAGSIGGIGTAGPGRVGGIGRIGGTGRPGGPAGIGRIGGIGR